VSNVDTCYVLTRYDAAFDRRYEEVIAPAIKSAKFNPKRADSTKVTGLILHQIQRGILGAKVVLADITGNNPNVMLELGLALAARKPVILLTQSLAELPSDLNGIRSSEYNTDVPKWDQMLSQTITAALRSIKKKPDSWIVLARTSPVPARREQLSDLEMLLYEILKSPGPEHMARLISGQPPGTKRAPRKEPTGEGIDVSIDRVVYRIRSRTRTTT